jgi:translation initiation factor IF-3
VSGQFGRRGVAGPAQGVPRRDRRVQAEEYRAISTHLRRNEQIRISPVRLIDQNENQVGIVPTAEAQRMAREAGLDLVEVASTARPPVCRIMDYGKYLYQQQKKQDKSRSHSRAGQLKELKIRTVRIGDHDLEIKINHAKEFLAEGNKVQFTLQFRGREMAHQELGREIFFKIKKALTEVCKVERDAKMEGRRMTMVLQPDARGSKPAGGAEKAAPRPAAAAPAGALRAPAPMTAGSSLGLKVPATEPAAP